jgi:HK97 family phage prohead protease
MSLDRAYCVVRIKDINAGRRFTGVASTIGTDRMGDIVMPRGMQATLPIPLLWQHDSSQPIGWVKATRTSDAAVEVDCEIADIHEPGTLRDRLNTAWQSITSGLVRGLSIGFKPLETARIEGGGMRYLAWELLELSAVTVAANVDATVTQIRSIDQALRRTASGALGAGTDPANVSPEDEAAMAQFERAFAAHDPEAMKAAMKSSAFQSALNRRATRRAGAMIQGGGTTAASHLARLALELATQAELRAALTKVQRARADALEARVDQVTQRLSAATKAIAALGRRS